MNIDATIEALEQRCQYQTPLTWIGRQLVEDKYMEQLKVRRKKGGATTTHHNLWCLSLADAHNPQQRVTFYGYRIKDVIKKAQEWAGIPTKTRNAQPQQPAG